MRQIKTFPIIVFLIIQSVILYLCIYTLGIEDADSVFKLNNICRLVLLSLFFNLVIYRIFLILFPFSLGSIERDGTDEFKWMIYTLFWLFFFHPIRNLNLVPTFLTPLTNKLLGGKMSWSSYNVGRILDPHLVEIGSNSIIGTWALIVPHYQEGDVIGHEKITIGNNVTIGACSTVLSGVTIGNNSIVGAMSLVPKNTKIGNNEIWAGVPCRKIKNIEKS